jgi:hypothetical protein
VGTLSIEVDVSSVYGSKTLISLIDSASLDPIPGYVNLQKSIVNISSIDPDTYPQIQLAFDLSGGNQSTASVNWFKIFWENDPGEVIQVKSFGPIHMVEDVPVKDIFDVTEYLTARDIDNNELSLEIVNVSNPAGIWPTLVGDMLSIDLPTENWNGNGFFFLRCSSDRSSLEVGPIKVYVEPVDDPPIIGEIGDLDVVEDQPRVLNLGPFITDVDTPINEVIVTVDSANCSINGHLMTFIYKEGGFSEGVLIQVGDGTSQVHRVIMVHVQAVDEPPMISDLPIIKMVEDEEHTIDLSSYINDEETPLETLTLMCKGPGLLAVEGMNLTLLFHQGGEYYLDFSVHDGSNTVHDRLIILVEEVNELPVIDSIGGNVPPIEIALGEGEELLLDIIAHDEEDEILSYELETDWRRMWLTDEDTIHISTEIGKIGSFNGTLIVKDSLGAEVSIEILVRVRLVNDPPFTPYILEPLNYSDLKFGEPITFNASVFDPDMVAGQVLSVIWTSNVTGEFKSLTSLDTSWFDIDTLPAGVHRIEVTVDDGEFAKSTWIQIHISTPQDQDPEPNDWGPSTWGPSPYLLIFILVSILLASWIWMRKRNPS